MSYRNLIVEVSGRLRHIHSVLVVDDVKAMVIELINESLARWKATGWFRYSDREGDCTVRLVHYAREAKRQLDSLILCEIHYDNPLLTIGMLEGMKSTSFATRPDLRILVGDIGISIECKRLGTHRNQPRNYVNDGIDRFVTGEYAMPNGFGIMVGYVQGGNRNKLLQKVNKVIETHSAMGPDNQLSALNGTQRCRSRHQLANAEASADPVQLEHFLPYIVQKAIITVDNP